MFLPAFLMNYYLFLDLLLRYWNKIEIHSKNGPRGNHDKYGKDFWFIF
jgi:hypothetical protein